MFNARIIQKSTNRCFRGGTRQSEKEAPKVTGETDVGNVPDSVRNGQQNMIRERVGQFRDDLLDRRENFRK